MILAYICIDASTYISWIVKQKSTRIKSTLCVEKSVVFADLCGHWSRKARHWLAVQSHQSTIGRPRMVTALGMRWSRFWTRAAWQVKDRWHGQVARTGGSLSVRDRWHVAKVGRICLDTYRAGIVSARGGQSGDVTWPLWSDDVAVPVTEWKEVWRHLTFICALRRILVLTCGIPVFSPNERLRTVHIHDCSLYVAPLLLAADIAIGFPDQWRPSCMRVWRCHWRCVRGSRACEMQPVPLNRITLGAASEIVLDKVWRVCCSVRFQWPFTPRLWSSTSETRHTFHGSAWENRGRHVG